MNESYASSFEHFNTLADRMYTSQIYNHLTPTSPMNASLYINLIGLFLLWAPITEIDVFTAAANVT